MSVFWYQFLVFIFRNGLLNRHQTILHTLLNFFLISTLSGVPYLYKQQPKGHHLSDLCKMCNLEADLWKMWIGDHRFLTYIFIWGRLNTTGHSSLSPSANNRLFHKRPIGAKTNKNLSTSHFSLGRHLCKPQILGFHLSYYVHVSVVSFGLNASLYHIILIVFDLVQLVEQSPDKVEPSPDEVKSHHWS